MAAKKLGQRNTRQRDVIFEVISKAKGPLTVQEILEAASQEIEKLGMATIYRTVNLLLENKNIQKIMLSDGQARYEACGHGHHHHFECRDCKKVYDFHSCPMPSPKPKLPKGFKIEGHEFTLFGLCADCAN